MNISIRGKTEHFTHNEIKRILNFFAHILLGKKLPPNITLKVFFRPYDGGACSLPLDYDTRTRNFREFEFIIDNSLDRETLVRAMAHEMEHLRQYARNELKCIHYNLFHWKGFPYRLTQENYPRVPWEVQARRSESWLVYFYQMLGA